MKRFLALLASATMTCALATAQEGATVNQTVGPPNSGWQTVFFYDGSSNLEYICYARSSQPERTITVSTASNANPVSFTATAHGLGAYGTHSAASLAPLVKITGGTGNWAAVNGTWKATVTSADAFTIAVDSTSFGAYGSQALTVTTRSPRTTDAVWSIKRFFYDGSNNLIGVGWAAAAGGASATTASGGGSGTDKQCSARANYAYQ